MKKALKVLFIITIVLSAICVVIGGILVFAGGIVIFHLSDVLEVVNGSDTTNNAIAGITILTSLLSGIVFIMGIVNLAAGIFGVRGAGGREEASKRLQHLKLLPSCCILPGWQLALRTAVFSCSSASSSQFRPHTLWLR